MQWDCLEANLFWNFYFQFARLNKIIFGLTDSWLMKLKLLSHMVVRIQPFKTQTISDIYRIFRHFFGFFQANEALFELFFKIFSETATPNGIKFEENNHEWWQVKFSKLIVAQINYINCEFLGLIISKFAIAMAVWYANAKCQFSA